MEELIAPMRRRVLSLRLIELDIVRVCEINVNKSKMHMGSSLPLVLMEPIV